MKEITILLFFCFSISFTDAQPTELITNIENRKIISLNGQWEILIDPYENGFYNYRYQEHTNGFFKNEKPATPQDLIEYDFVSSDYLNVPGDWNSQREKLEYYEGTIWYKKSFPYKTNSDKKVYLYIGAANYHSHVYVNGKKIGEHEGGFTPFNFDITGMLKEKDNFIVIKVDNKRKADGVPTLNTDWWNYGGLTRDIYLVETNKIFIQDYSVELKKGSLKNFSVRVKLNEPVSSGKISFIIPELHNGGYTYTLDNHNSRYFREFGFDLMNEFDLWSPENPKLYEVLFIYNNDTLRDKIGFRTIETKGTDILLNGKPIFLKGICIHEEIPQRVGRANGYDDAKQLLGWAKELGCNYVRLAHYPHNEAMVRLADQIGLMVWSEIPVYWTIQYSNSAVQEKALSQLSDMITRDKNRASVIIWSMANETPPSEARNNFLKALCDRARMLDSTRLLSAALEIHNNNGKEFILDDKLGEYLDVLGCNEYVGWYSGTPESCLDIKWSTPYNKPLVISEFGGEALYNKHGERNERWTEEYMEYMYECQLKMLDKISFLRGLSPWILADFRSPRRQLHGTQDMWNRKGLISDKGFKKKAYFVMKKYYEKK
jgi:beta-glucuronidase